MRNQLAGKCSACMNEYPYLYPRRKGWYCDHCIDLKNAGGRVNFLDGKERPGNPRSQPDQVRALAAPCIWCKQTAAFAYEWLNTYTSGHPSASGTSRSR